MRKNVASQVVGAQMITAADGTAFTGSVTVYVTGNGGTQAVGSVGSGACTHEGNGFHTYAPAQAETNYDHIAFTFVGTGAVAATVQVYPSYPQTGDNYARIGAPVGASISADIAAVQSDTDNIQTRIPAALVSGRIDASVGAMATDVLTSTALAASAVTEIQTGLSTLDAAAVRSAIGLATANLDTQLGAIAGYIDTEVGSLVSSVAALPTAAGIADAVWDEVLSGHLTGGTTGNALNAAGAAGDPWSTTLPGAYSAGTAGYIVGNTLDAAISSRMATFTYTAPLDAAGVATAVWNAATATYGSAGSYGLLVETNLDALISSRQATHDATERNAIADALLKRDMSAVTGESARSPLNALRFLRNAWSISGTTLTVTKEDDSTSAWTATVTAAPGADPISGSDPA